MAFLDAEINNSCGWLAFILCARLAPVHQLKLWFGKCEGGFWKPWATFWPAFLTLTYGRNELFHVLKSMYANVKSFRPKTIFYLTSIQSNQTEKTNVKCGQIRNSKTFIWERGQLITTSDYNIWQPFIWM